MKKKLFALMLVLAFVCTAMVPALAEEAPAETTPVSRVLVLNNAVADMEKADTPDSRFNAWWVPAYSLKDVLAANVWFTPDDNDLVTVTSFADGYTDDGSDTYATLSAKSLSFGFVDGESTYDVFCGPNQSKDWMVTSMGFFAVGHEAFVFVPADGWKVTDLFAAMKKAFVPVTEAESYDFICADGYTEEILAVDLDKVSIFMTEAGTIDSSSVAYPTYTLNNIRYIVPSGLKQGDEAPEGVCHLTVAPNAEGILGVEAPMIENYGGSMHDCYSIAELLTKYEIEPTMAKGVSWKDGSEYVYTDLDAFKASYISFDVVKAFDAFTLGKIQPRKAYCKNAGYYILGADALLYVPRESDLPGGWKVKELFEAIGMEEAESYNFVCADGYTEEILAVDLDKVSIFTTEAGTVDSSSVAYPTYTLNNILTIVPVK